MAEGPSAGCSGGKEDAYYAPRRRRLSRTVRLGAGRRVWPHPAPFRLLVGVGRPLSQTLDLAADALGAEPGLALAAARARRAAGRRRRRQRLGDQVGEPVGGALL